MMKPAFRSAAACAARSPSTRPLFSIARITASLTPCDLSATSWSGSIVKIGLSRSISARITASVTPARESDTMSSRVSADARTGTSAAARTIARTARRWTKGRICVTRATVSPAKWRRNLRILRGCGRRGALAPGHHIIGKGHPSSCGRSIVPVFSRVMRTGPPRRRVRGLPLRPSRSSSHMLSNRLAFAALAVACIGAAAGGGYLASRQNAVPVPAAAQAQPATAEAPAPPAAVKPVQETEATVAEAPARPAPPAKQSAKRAEQAPRAAASTPAPSRTAAARQDPPPLASTWPSGAAAQPPAAPTPPPAPEPPPAPRPDDRAGAETPRATEPPAKTFEELVVSPQTVIGLATETKLSSETARVEDRVDAKVTRDVKVGDRIAIPSGARAIGSVTQVERGGKFKERAVLGIRFHTLVLADGTRLPISTETIYRYGEAPGNGSAAKVGGAAVGGAILGAILGGAKGAAIGATAGAGGGTAAVMAGDRSNATLPAGTPMTVRILQPVTVTTEKN